MDRREFIQLTALGAALGHLVDARGDDEQSSVLDVGNEPILFLDDWCVQRTVGVHRVLHQPQKQGLIKEADGSDWQTGDAYHGKIVCRDHAGKFHMTYRYLWWDPELQKVAAIGIDKAHWQRETVGYATSDDGIHWQKPKLGVLDAPAGFRKQDVFPFEIPTGLSKDNNLGCPIDFAYDLHAHGNISDPDKRFLLRYARREDTNQFAPVVESQMYYSADWPDFVHDPEWRAKLTPLADGRLSPRGFKTLAGYDHDAQEWFFVGQDTISNWLPRGGRDIARFASPDLVQWNGPQLVFPVANDESRTPEHWIEYMDLQAYRVGGPRAGSWLGQLVVFDSDRRNEQSVVPTLPGVWRKGLTELRLVVSRDAGRTWQRVGDTQVWLPHHEADDGFDRLVFAAPPVKVDDELRFYYSCFDGDHLVFNKDGTTYYPNRTREGRTAWATLRADGYVSFDADSTSGEILTKPLRMAGAMLVVNVDASKGALSVEIQQPSGEAIEGFSAADCLPIQADGVQHPVRWRNQNDLRHLLAKPIRLRFLLRDASLYAFRTA